MMVRLVDVQSGFQAEVLVARLGAAGVLARPSGAVGGPYPIGAVHVEVAAADLDLARQLLLADEIEAVFNARETQAERGASTRRRHALAPWVIVGAAMVTEAVAVAAGF